MNSEEQGQSSIDLDIQGAETQLAMGKCGGQLLEDVEKVGSMETSALFFPQGRPVSMSPSNDDPLVYQKAVDHLRREKALRPSPYTGDASRSYQVEGFEFERPYCGLSRYTGDEFKPTWQSFSEVQLPTEIRKSELRDSISDIEQRMTRDPRFYSLLWTLKHQQPGPGRYKAIAKFWQKVYEERQPEDLNLILKSFLLNDFLQAQDELYTLEHPMRPPPDVRSWGYPWSRRSSAVTVGSGSLSFHMVGPESGPGSGLMGTCAVRRRPPYT
jgi:hypothetical protein